MPSEGRVIPSHRALAPCRTPPVPIFDGHSKAPRLCSMAHERHSSRSEGVKLLSIVLAEFFVSAARLPVGGSREVVHAIPHDVPQKGHVGPSLYTLCSREVMWVFVVNREGNAMNRREKTRQGRSGARRRPGQSAREQQRFLVNRDPINAAITRFFGVPSAEQAWGQGAAGEERVGGLLNQFRQFGWTVIHDLKLGSNGANVDHLVIGPPGVFVIDAKNVSGNVWVAGSNIWVDGFSKNYVEEVEEQAMRVRKRFLAATGWASLWVQGVLVFVASTPTVKEQPSHVAVVTDDAIVSVLQRWPAKYDQAEVEELARAAMGGRIGA
ncbi:NERD domain-containing protein [Cystobacter fuscus]|uniref:nuclease-related domain-containing protein n=1 Tax=Cystobacter fuscus TaxID=43 RepID=UPI002B2A2BE7|nr:NERD domain-containing protein [Cystobacter fuscus]